MQHILADRTIGFLCGGILLAAALYMLYVGLSLNPTELQVATRYTAFGETQYYRNKWYYLIGFVVFGGVMAVMHVVLIAKLRSRGMRPLAIALGLCTFILFAILFIVARSVLAVAYLS